MTHGVMTRRVDVSLQAQFSNLKGTVAVFEGIDMSFEGDHAFVTGNGE